MENWRKGKMKRQIILTVIIGLSLSITSFTQAAIYGGGSGDPNNPFQIWTPEQMNTIGLHPEDWGSHFKLMADISMSIYYGTQYNIIGNETTPFTGTFDGNNHVIRNVAYYISEWVGLFGYISAGRIQNLGLDNFNITGGSEYIGSLAGYVESGILYACYATGSVSNINAIGIVGGLVGRNESGLISACYTTNSVNGCTAGGLVGINGGSLIACYATGSIEGTDCVGGLTGLNFGPLHGCYTNGFVSGSTAVGGLVGRNIDCSINTCYATGTVTGTQNIGGIAGKNSSGSVTSCYSSGAIIGNYNVGGLVGVNEGLSLLNSCYATGPIDGTNWVGGFVGYNDSGELTDCYARGLVTGTGDYVGGFAGYMNTGTILGCFWDMQSTDQAEGIGNQKPAPSNVIGLNTFEMQMLSNFTQAGWDFINMWDIGTGQTYPYLKSFNNINPADTNYNGVVDMEDLAILAANWLKEE